MPARLLAGSALALMLFAGALPADPPPPLVSGPQVGAKNNRRGFTPRWVTGPCAGQYLCPV